jgi:hypothetical protein
MDELPLRTEQSANHRTDPRPLDCLPSAGDEIVAVAFGPQAGLFLAGLILLALRPLFGWIVLRAVARLIAIRLWLVGLVGHVVLHRCVSEGVA